MPVAETPHGVIEQWREDRERAGEYDDDAHRLVVLLTRLVNSLESSERSNG